MRKLLSLCIAVAFLTTGIVRGEDADDTLPEETGNSPMVQGEPGAPPAPIAGAQEPTEMAPPPPSSTFTTSSNLDAKDGTIVAKKGKKKKKAKKAKKAAKKKSKKKKRR